MIRCLWLALICGAAFHVYAQENPFTDSLKRNLETASSDAEKVKWLGTLSNFYFPVNRKLSDDYNLQQFQLAETSRDRKLMVLAMLSNARRHYNMSGSQENINTGVSISEKALDLARSSALDEHQAWSYIYLALGARLNGENDKALNYNNLALSIISTLDSDSLSVNGYNSIGNTYNAKNEKMLAFRNYLHALSIAEESDNYFLLRGSYASLANFYLGLDEFEKAKDYWYKNLRLTHRFNNKIDRLDVYNNLGRVYANNKQFDLALEFYQKSIALADTLKFELVKLNSYGSILDMYMANNENKKALEFFNSKPELQAFMRNAGFEYIVDQAFGMAYTSISKFDSASHYLRKAEIGFETKASKANRLWFYNNMGTFYKKKGDFKNALIYYQKAQHVSEDTRNMGAMQLIHQNLDSVYQRLGDFKSAYFHNNRYQQLKDSVEKLSTEKDLMLLEVDNENKRKERAAVQAEEDKRTRHNIQYMGITAAIAGVFIVLVMLGIFSVSAGTIRILGFFAFIFLFEFIILLADNQIHHWTHGEPWKILAIKIGLISVLLPLHHFMEKKVIHYLTSRKMLELNANTILSKIIPRKNSESDTVEQ
ncbi:MAG TPA: tetratricopeptide repeat protein [Ohtaekwangia sp.]